MTQPSTPMTDDNRLTNPEPTPKPPSPSQATNLVTTEMIPHGRSLKRTLSTCSSSLSDDINNTVMMTLGLEEDSCQYDFEPNPNKQKVHKDPQTASNQKLIDATRDQSQKHVSVPTSEVSTASSSNRSDEVPSNKLSAPSLPPPEHQSSTPPTSCHSKTESVSCPATPVLFITFIIVATLTFLFPGLPERCRYLNLIPLRMNQTHRRKSLHHPQHSVHARQRGLRAPVRMTNLHRLAALTISRPLNHHSLSLPQFPPASMGSLGSTEKVRWTAEG